MSTRATISVKDKYDSFCIYRHSDGYPEGQHGAVAGITKALAYAWDLPRFEAMDFSAALVAAMKQEGGGGIYLTEGHDAHEDTEFQYFISYKAGHIQLRIRVPGEKKNIFKGTLEEAMAKYYPEEEAVADLSQPASTIVRLKNYLKNYPGYTPCAYSLWLPEDVLAAAEDMEEDPELTQDEVAEVLHWVEVHKDANRGINWDTITDAIETIVERRTNHA